MADGAGSIALVGLHGGEWFGAAAGAALSGAAFIVGDERHLKALPGSLRATRVPSPPSIAELLDQVGGWRDAGASVCMIASGDPGFFGLARLASARFGEAVRVMPAPSSVSLAFARAGFSWDDAVVVSAHGRQPGAAAEAAVRHPKVAVLTSPDQPPEAIGALVAARDCGERVVVVASRLGEPDEAVWRGDIASLAAGRFDGLSVVLFIAPDAVPGPGPGLAWGLPDTRFDHRDGMITKAEVRAVALGKLAIPPSGVLWDVGAGSGSVCAECARLAPGLRIFAVERRADDAERMRRNLAGTAATAATAGTAATAATVIEGEAPAALAGLPDPDRVFIGGGGAPVLEESLRRLRPGGTVVATFAALDRAAAAASMLGNLVQVAVSRGARVGPDGAFRLEAENPVFVCWGGK